MRVVHEVDHKNCKAREKACAPTSVNLRHNSKITLLVGCVQRHGYH